MKLIKKILGFNSPYSWTKWLRMAALTVALFFTVVYLINFAGMGFIGFIIAFIIFIPTFAVLIAATMAIGAVIGAAGSGKKQARSLRESAASGSAELVNLDKARIKAQTLRLVFVIVCIVTIIAGIVTAVSSVLTVDGEAVGFGASLTVTVAGVILLLVLGVMRARLDKSFGDSFKEQVVRKELESFLEIIEYSPDRTLDESAVKDSGLFPGYNIYAGNDLLTAVYKNRRFSQSDINLTETSVSAYTDTDGETRSRTEYKPVFKGRLMVFDYGVITGDSVFVWGTRSLRPSNHAKAIKTELDMFNKYFSVSAKDEVSAFRVLTPQVIEGIALARGKLNRSMSLAFKGDKIYVAVSSGDSFEAAVAGDATLLEQRERIRDEIKIVLDMAETLYIKK